MQYAYDLKVSTQVNTQTKGKLPLTGLIDANLTLATGKFEADLTLDDTTGKLTALGFLPVTVKLGFQPEGKTTGKLSNGKLESTSNVTINLRDAKVMGSIPLAGGENCKTKKPSEIKLASEGDFRPLGGGKLVGTYAIGELTGCGSLGGLVSPLTAGGGNTISLDLTPKAEQGGEEPEAGQER